MFRKINGKNIAVDVFGEGEALLLIHGLGGSSNSWRPLINEFSGNFKIIAPDLPSAAGSELDPELSISSLAHDMISLLDEMDIEKAHIVGHSMGTIVCQHMAAIAPKKVIDLILLGPLAQPPEPARAALQDRAALARSEGMTAIADTIADVALSKETKLKMANVQGFVREMIIRQNPEGYAQSCNALSKATQADPTLIKCPCLLITGDEDVVAPEANVEVLCQQLPDAEMHVLQQCGHWTATEKPTEVNGYVRNFYKL
ncbi:MAG: alpha/beta fold hydrolase [Gammaproteobacteria bacterium]|nr:alpha/beta fold hydrolase [Gammaproteobacteria bacterium]